jgi:hypothetical protein
MYVFMMTIRSHFVMLCFREGSVMLRRRQHFALCLVSPYPICTNPVAICCRGGPRLHVIWA